MDLPIALQYPWTRPPRRRRAGGAFTLIEIVLVVAIIGILAALTVPRYGSAVDRYRADAAAKRVVHDLNLAKARARATSSSRSVAFDVNTRSYQLPGEADLKKSSSTYTVLLAERPYEAAIDSADFGGAASVSFNAFGVPGSGGKIVIRAGGEVRTITLDAEGVAAIQRS